MADPTDECKYCDWQSAAERLGQERTRLSASNDRLRATTARAKEAWAELNLDLSTALCRLQMAERERDEARAELADAQRGDPDFAPAAVAAESEDE